MGFLARALALSVADLNFYAIAFRFSTYLA